MTDKTHFYNFNKIYIEKKVSKHKNIVKILDNINSTDAEILYTENIYDLIKTIPPVYHPQDRAKSLYLGAIRGDILQRCPGSHGHICCNYHVINLYVGCPINCSYCILQSYLNQPFTIINIDLETIFDELHYRINNDNKFYRIGTGELGDSLVYDPLTNFSSDFINFFSEHKNSIFEFKTKTNFIDNILKYDSPGNIVIGFSVNPDLVISKEESFANTITERLSAAKLLIEKGYKIALHFDPIINIKDYKAEYKKLINLIFQYVSSSDIAWISLGTFRYIPNLKNMMEYNYPESDILYDEFLENNDKKFRYFKPIRQAIYNFIIDSLKEYGNKMLIYLCMESPDIWNNTIGYLPFNEDKMNLVFKNAVK